MLHVHAHLKSDQDIAKIFHHLALFAECACIFVPKLDPLS